MTLEQCKELMRTHSAKTGNPPFEEARLERIARSLKVLSDLKAETAAILLTNTIDENAKLRRLLAVSYSGASLYRDDGELQDNSQYPFIDFKNDTVEAIERSMNDRGVANVKAMKS